MGRSAVRLRLGGLLLPFIIGSGCAGDRPPGELDHADLPLERVPLKGRVAAADSLLGRPLKLESTSDWLIVTDLLSDTPIFVFEAGTGRLAARLGSRGEGPGEFLRPHRPYLSRSDSTLWVLDLGLQRLTAFSLAGPPRPGSAWDRPLGTVPLDPVIRLTDAAMDPGKGWLGTGFLAASRLVSISLEGTTLEAVGRLPGQETDVPLQALAQAYQSVVAPALIEGRLAVATTLAGRLDLCDRRGSCIEARTPYPFQPTYELRSGDGGAYILDTLETRRGYLDLDATEGAVYALFSGRSEGAYRGLKAFGRFVHVFDWSGAPLAVLELDHDAVGMAVSPDERTLYTLIHDPLPAVMAYPLASR